MVGSSPDSETEEASVPEFVPESMPEAVPTRIAPVPVEAASASLRAAIDQLHIGVSVLDLQRRFVSFNEAYGDMVRRSPLEATRFHLSEVTHADDRPAVDVAIGHLLSRAHAHASLTRRTLYPTDGFHWVKETYSLQPGGEGDRDAARIVAVSVSVHAERMAEEALRENGDPLGFARVVAGTLQGALNVSNSMRGLLFDLAEPESPMKHEETLQRLSTQRDLLHSAVSQVFFLARKKFLGS